MPFRRKNIIAGTAAGAKSGEKTKSDQDNAPCFRPSRAKLPDERSPEKKNHIRSVGRIPATEWEISR